MEGPIPDGSFLDWGMTLPGKQPAELLDEQVAFSVGSVIRTSELLLFSVLEKSPLRSSAVGVYLVCVPPFRNWPVFSCDQKKNSFFFCVLKTFGMKTGPPTL